MFVATVGIPVYVVSFSIFRAVVMRDALVVLWRTRFVTIRAHVGIVLGRGIVSVCGIVDTLRIQKEFFFLELFSLGYYILRRRIKYSLSDSYLLIIDAFSSFN